MIILKISGPDGQECYKLHPDLKRESELKSELLGKYPDDTEITIEENGIEIDKLRLEDLFKR